MATHSRGRGRSLVRAVGERAHRPRTAATVVGATAVVFSAIWFASQDLALDTPVPVLLVATVANAYAVTWVVWAIFVPTSAWSYVRGFLVGSTVGLVSHLTIGFVWLFVAALFGGPAAISPVQFLLTGLLLGGASVSITLGAPIATAILVALGLTHCRRRVPQPSAPARK